MIARLSLSATGRLLEDRQRLRPPRRSSRSEPARSPSMAQDVLARRCHSSTDRRARAAISLVRGRGRDVSGGGAARLARDRGVQHERRHACGQRFERRQAESFVFGQKREDRRAPIQGRERGVIHIRTDGDAIRVPASASNRVEIDCGLRPILADDLELSISHAIGNEIEGLDQTIDPPPLEQRTDEQNERRTIVQTVVLNGRSDDRSNGRWYDRSRANRAHVADADVTSDFRVARTRCR